MKCVDLGFKDLVSKRNEEEKRHKIAQNLLTIKPQRVQLKRELSDHITTRWYRAPEIIIREKDYGPAIDMWAIGCVFADLLNMIRDHKPDPTDRKSLFPGKSCYPLSPDPHIKIKISKESRDEAIRYFEEKKKGNIIELHYQNFDVSKDD